MKTLAMETTEAVGTIAAMDAGRLLVELELPPHKRSAQSLAPGLRKLVGQVGWTPNQVQLVAVSIGPGSFTGLRIGVTTAKAFAYATGAGIIGVSTLDAIANQAPKEAAPLWVAIDAHRRQVFASRLIQQQHGKPRQCGPAEILASDHWLAGLQQGDWVTGPALRQHAQHVPDGVRIVEPSLWPPTAAAVARLAWYQYQAGKRDDIWQLEPRYIRPSAAEEKWQQNAK